jgi:hypothetical protein
MVWPPAAVAVSSVPSASQRPLSSNQGKVAIVSPPAMSGSSACFSVSVAGIQDGTCGQHRANELLGREATAERVLDVGEAVTGQRVFEELPEAVTVLQSVGFAAAVGIGTLRQIVTVIIALAGISAEAEFWAAIWPPAASIICTFGHGFPVGG